MNKENIKFLKSAEGKKVLEDLSRLSWNKRHKYLFNSDEKIREHVSAASALLEIREKAKEKFSLASEMFFSSLNLEQATSEKISSHIAKRFNEEFKIADLGCGIASNSIFIAKKCKSVVAVEKDESTFLCAKENAIVYGVDKKVEFINSDVYDYINSERFIEVDAVFIDPARNRDNKNKTRSILNSEPKILEILPKIFKQTKNVAIKISPAFDWQEILLLPEEPEVELISERNNLKLAILWFGDLKRNKRSATCFRNNQEYFFSSQNNNESAPFFQEEKDIIFEVDKAITRANLANSLANYYNLEKIDSRGSYLFSDKEIDGPGRNLRLIIFNKESLNKFKEDIKKLKIERAEIIAKNHFLKPDEIRKKLKLKDGGDYVVYVVDKKYFILAKKVN